MDFDKHRFEIWNQTQHPYKHTLSDFAYANNALPGVSNVNDALNWLVKVLYPTSKPAVATTAALPLVGNTLNDYRVVLDDGDGKNAGYRWEQREGDVSPQWYKVFDFDWSTDSILAAFTNITQDLYVYQKGKTDLNSAGAAITGTFAGQTINGGNSANQNLTLKANSGDGTGPRTGYVQVDDNFRPTSNNLFDLGTTGLRFKDGFYAGTVSIGNLSLSSGLITDSSGALSFDNENLTTTGNITGAIGYYTSSVEVGPLAGSALILSPGSITDESGAISFGNENLTTTGTLGAGVTTLTDGLETLVFDPDVSGVGSITSSTGTISFGNENLTTTGNITGAILTGSSLQVDNINIDGNTISSTNTNGDIILLPNGTGIVDVQKTLETLDQNVTGILDVVGSIQVDNLNLNGNVLSATDTNGNVVITPNGTGVVQVTADISPSTDNARDLGTSSLRFQDLFLSGSISDGTTSVTQSTLQSLRDINVGVGVGFTIFWDGAKWVASAPDSEIDHGTLSGLGDDDHTQYALLAGRAGGQELIGGTAASNHLTLESTSNVTKGFVRTKDTFVPFTNASYSGGWSGTDLGGASNYFRDIYLKGEAKGFRLENYLSSGLPSPSVQNVGRLVYATDTKKIYVDDGTAFVVAGASKYVSDTSWDGVATAQNFTVSGSIQDARNAIWQLCDNSNDFERIYCTIKAISATQVRVEVNPALPAGSYRLIGIE